MKDPMTDRPDVVALSKATLIVHQRHGILLDTAGVHLSWYDYIAAILDALPEGAALVVNWDEMTLHLQELGAQQESERLRAALDGVGTQRAIDVSTIDADAPSRLWFRWSDVIDIFADPEEADR